MTSYSTGDFKGSETPAQVACVYNAGDFTFIKDAMSKAMLEDGYKTVTDLDMWNWMATFTPEEGKGFMYSNHENINKIGKAMKTGHSGASFGWTMRNMEAIAKDGWETYVKGWMKE